ncbi:hypothetical protein [Yersinia frederiksenii]|uniref:Uncharacterized protein n=1 Tax=Yersinia frederiksenii TaxID=29484 RepID=A0AAI8ZQ66_YERFR|nr:hypothetical protein [Yersinia frederiksenii]CFQ96681.1 Uncharacterised protein [Yersinia frederiksenii]
MQYAIAGYPASGCSTNYLTKIQHLPAYRRTSASFTPPPRKGIWEKIIEALTRRIEP